jgi:hypothetical protein
MEITVAFIEEIVPISWETVISKEWFFNGVSYLHTWAKSEDSEHFLLLQDEVTNFEIANLRAFENCALLGYYAANRGNFLPTSREW